MENADGKKRSSDVLDSESVEKAYIAIKTVIASLSKTAEADVVTQFNEIVATYGVDPLNSFQCADKHRHHLIHLLVNWNKTEVIRALGEILELNVQRPKVSKEMLFFLLSMHPLFSHSR